MRWFVAYVILVIIGGLLEPFAPHSNQLPDSVIGVFFVLNINVVCIVVFTLIQNFLRAKNEDAPRVPVNRCNGDTNANASIWRFSIFRCPITMAYRWPQ